MTSQYTLYAAPFSLYSGKARAYLDYKQIPYEEQFSSVNVYKKVIVPNTGVRFIPVVKTPDEQYLQDTTVIIEHLEKQFPSRPVIPASPRQKLVSYLFEIWADEWLLLPAMHYRWNKDNFPFIFEEFGSIVAPMMPRFVKAMLGKKLGKRFRGFVPILGITDNTIPALEDWYENHVLFYLNKHFAEHSFVFGDCPSLADFSLMGPLYAHLYRDPAPGELMKKLAPNVVAWIKRMQQPIEAEAQWLANDEIPKSLEPLLQRMFSEHWPVLLNTVVELEEWANAYPDLTEIPRSIGEMAFSLGNTKDKRAVLTFAQWKLQRVLNVYQQLTEQEKTSVDDMLHQLEGFDAMQFKINRPVSRKKGRLYFDPQRI